MKNTIIVVFIMLAGMATLHADTDTERTIAVPGSAVVEIAPDRLVIVFELLTERRTFAEAADGAREMASALESIDLQSHDVLISVEYDLTFMKQKSWGRGRKLEHRFEMTIDEIPEGRVQELMVYLVDKSLELDNALAVEQYEARLSESREEATRKLLLEQAVSDARSNATVLAAAAGLRVGSPLTISLGGGSPFSLSPGVAEMDAYVPGRFYQRSFGAGGNLPSRIRQSASVFVQFEVE